MDKGSREVGHAWMSPRLGLWVSLPQPRWVPAHPMSFTELCKRRSRVLEGEAVVHVCHRNGDAGPSFSDYCTNISPAPSDCQEEGDLPKQIIFALYKFLAQGLTAKPTACCSARSASSSLVRPWCLPVSIPRLSFDTLNYQFLVQGRSCRMYRAWYSGL